MWGRFGNSRHKSDSPRAESLGGQSIVVCVELAWEAQECLVVLQEAGIRVKGRSGIDALAIWRQQDYRAEISRGAGYVLGNNTEERLHIGNRFAERVGRGPQCAGAAGLVGWVSGGRS